MDLYQLFYSKQTNGLKWSASLNVVAVSQWVLGLLWRLMELILEGARLYLRTDPAQNLPWLDAPTQWEQFVGLEGGGGGHHAAGCVSSEVSKRAKEQQFEIILINNIQVKGVDWDDSVTDMLNRSTHTMMLTLYVTHCNYTHWVVI